MVPTGCALERECLYLGGKVTWLCLAKNLTIRSNSQGKKRPARTPQKVLHKYSAASMKQTFCPIVMATVPIAVHMARFTVYESTCNSRVLVTSSKLISKASSTP